MSTKVYIYDKNTGLFKGDDTGDPKYILLYDLADNEDFTFIPPPDNQSLWYWVNDKWQLEPKEVQSDKDL